MFSWFKQISRSEWYFIFLISGLVIFLSTLSYLYGYFISPGYFTWNNHENFGDTAVYLSLINQARSGEIFLQNLFTSEFTFTYALRPFFLLLGFGSWILGGANILIFQIARILISLGLLVFLYLLTAQFVTDRFTRQISFLLMAFGSGLGWLFSPPVHRLLFSEFDHWRLFQTTPADFYLLESNIFAQIFYSALAPLALLCLLFLLGWFIQPESKLNKKLAFLIFVLVIFLGFDHPFDLISLFLVTGFFFLVLLVKNLLYSKEKISLWPYGSKLIVIGLAIAFSAIYYFSLLYFDPGFLVWGNQNLTETPPWYTLVLGYGLIGSFAILGLFFVDWKNPRHLFLVCWPLVLLFCSYLPFNFQRRVLSSVIVPLSILAAFGLNFLFLSISRRSLSWVKQLVYLALIFLVFGLSNFSIIWSNLKLYRETNSFYLPTDVYQGLKWLDQQTNQVVLATPFVANNLPALSTNKIYAGHIIQTKDYAAKVAEIKDWFFKDNLADEKKHQWLKDRGIDYIFYSEFEKSLGSFKPAEKDYLLPVYHNATVEIYRVL